MRGRGRGRRRLEPRARQRRRRGTRQQRVAGVRRLRVNVPRVQPQSRAATAGGRGEQQRVEGRDGRHELAE